MNTKKRIILGVAGLSVVALTAYAAEVITDSGVFRTTGYFIGLTQGTNPKNGHPINVNASFSGRNLVNLAMGRQFNDTNFPNQVLAMTFAPDMSTASLAVYDESISNVVDTIAASVSMDTVKQQDKNQPGPNSAHFVAMMQIAETGSWVNNGVLGGYFTVSGHVSLNPQTGSPAPLVFDRGVNGFDADVDVPASADPDAASDIQRTGAANVMGVVDVVNSGKTNTVLVPFGSLSIRSELPIVQAPIYTGGS